MTLSSEESIRLLSSIQDLGIRCGIEHSVRGDGVGLSEQRWLVSFVADELAPRLSSLLQSWKFPLASFSITEYLKSATHVHLGIECTERGDTVRKVYFEDARVYERKSSERCKEPVFRALKWHCQEGSDFFETKYYVRGFGNSYEAAEFCASCFDVVSVKQQSSINLMLWEFIQHLMQTMFPARPKILEVSEDGTPRNSFDINLYDGLDTVMPLENVITEICEAFKFPVSVSQPLQRLAQTKKIGHLAGGIHRQDGQFLTIYYDARPFV